MNRLFLVLLVCVLCFADCVSADPFGSGSKKLEDGRAFRIDSEGNQIVDEIAELELQRDTFKEQVRALESEIEAKDRVISRLKSAATTPRFLEASAQDDDYSGDCTIDGEDAKDRVASLKNTISKMVRDLADSKAEHKALLAKFDTVSKEADSGQKSNVTSQMRRQKELEETIEALNEQNTALLKQVEELSSAYNSREGKLYSAAARIDKKDEKIESLLELQQDQAEKLVRLEKALASSQEEYKTLSQKYANLSNAAIEQSRTYLAARARVAPSRLSNSAGVENVRSSIMEKADTLRQLISKRDALYRKYSKLETKPVTFSPFDARNSRSEGVNEMVNIAKSSRSFAVLSRINRDLGTITNKIKSDIALINRLL